MNVVQLAQRLRDETRTLRQGSLPPGVATCYNPLEYAWDLHRNYCERFGQGRKHAVFIGLNPGPFGMGQCGVPFGEVSFVKDWMKLSGSVKRPEPEHPKRPILGLDCKRSEVSGKRLWGLFSGRFPKADDFFAQHFVANWCPLLFMGPSGANLTPDKLRGPMQDALDKVCDQHLHDLLAVLKPRFAVGVGGFAEKRLEGITLPTGCTIARLPHPSPANPAANKGWSALAEKALREQGIWA